MMSAAIMQPTYLPWVGYFALMDRVDQFVFLDSVQFERRSWQQRNRIKTANGALLLTVPVLKKGRYQERIMEVEIDCTSDFARKHIRAIESAYRRAPYFDAFAPALFAHFERGHNLLAELNIAIILWMAQVFGIFTPSTRSSAMKAAGKREGLLVAICRELGTDRYVSPPAAHAYLDESMAFRDAGIALEWHDYAHPMYRQLHGPFLSHMSAIDLLFNMGPGSLAVIRSGL
jgi:hypothetical protein